jgi:hypothetical protein
MGFFLIVFSADWFASIFGIKARNPSDQDFLDGASVALILIPPCIVGLLASMTSHRHRDLA